MQGLTMRANTVATVSTLFSKPIVRRIKRLSVLLSVLAAVTSTGCTATWYEMMENGRVVACEPLHGQERAECLDQARMPYGAYEQEREQALSKER